MRKLTDKHTPKGNHGAELSVGAIDAQSQPNNNVTEEDTTMKKNSKAAKALAKANTIPTSQTIDKASQEATVVSSLLPTPPSAEQKINEDNLKNGDEATEMLTKVADKVEEKKATKYSRVDPKTEKVCPNCGEKNRRNRVTCISCHTKLAPTSVSLDDAKTAKSATKAQVQKAKIEKATKYSRRDSVPDAIIALGSFTMEQLIDKADAIAVENKLSSNKKETIWCIGYALPSLLKLNVLTLKEDTYTYKK